MSRLTKGDLVSRSDLIEREVFVPSLEGNVLVRSLPAAYANQAQSEALEMRTDAKGRQSAVINTVRLEELQVLHGLADPKFESIEEVRAFGLKNGRAWRVIVEAIDEISGIDKEAVEQANARFQAGGGSAPGPDVDVADGARDNGSDLPLRAGA
jgi:hypothetical protein